MKDFLKHSTALKSRTNSVQRALLYVQNVATDLERDLFKIIKKIGLERHVWKIKKSR